MLLGKIKQRKRDIKIFIMYVRDDFSTKTFRSRCFSKQITSEAVHNIVYKLRKVLRAHPIFRKWSLVNESFRDARKQIVWGTLVNSSVAKFQGEISIVTHFGDRHAFITTSQTSFVKLAGRT